MQTRRTTLADVARAAGVSKATASRVLGGSADRVSDELRERVLRAAADLDYVPNPHAQALARAVSPLVALIVHDVADPYFSEIARGVFHAAAESDRLVMICNTFRDPDRELAYLRTLRAQRVQAVLVAGTARSGFELGSEVAAELDLYRAEGGQVAVMVAGHGYPAAVPDDRGGGRQVGEHLLALGHRQTAVIAGPSGVGSVDERLAGFLDALVGSGAPEPVVVHSDFTRRGGADAVDEILAARPGTTAIFAHNDLMAVGAIRRLAAAGRRVPDDVSVAGFDDMPLAEDLQPPLTTVRVPLAELGAEALRMALDGAPGDETRLFETTLVARGSTAPVDGR
ncbi:MAG: LacI family DNA-binding transcriptional regulator [Actinomycetes bacterium]|nr:LacI family transcriptional regulator [Acidimicrobiia bacterium]